MVVIMEYFTSGLGFDDPSLFNRSAMMVSQVGLSVMLLTGLVYVWLRVMKGWHMARKALRVGEVIERERGAMETKVVDTEKSLTDIDA
jgi:hypothetical protein